MNGLFFDARYIRVEHHDGISRFSAGLFTALSKMTAVTAIISDLRQLEKLPEGVSFVKVSDPTSPLEPLVALKLNKLGAKVVFSPMQTIGSFGRKFNLILTVHDLIYYRHPAPPPSFNLAVKLLWRMYHLSYLPQRFLLNQCDAVVTVSKTTKALIQKHKLTRKPVSVVYNAAGEVSASLPAQAKSKKLIYMGSFMDYKNVEVLINGMKFLSEYELHLLSRISPERKSELQELASTGAKVVFHNGVSDAEYSRILAEATALVSGSRDEGFGIPVIEAMSIGIPAVISNIDIFREIGEEAAIYFDQESPESFAGAVRKLDDPTTWSEISRQSQIQAAKFNWDTSAQALLKVIDSL